MDALAVAWRRAGYNAHGPIRARSTDRGQTWSAPLDMIDAGMDKWRQHRAPTLPTETISNLAAGPIEADT